MNNYRLKRTKSIGLLDEFIEPTKKLIEEAKTIEILLPNVMDDTNIKSTPEDQVDYLTYRWTDDEVSESWKYIIDSKRSINKKCATNKVNKLQASRLENASWRTWARTRLSLKQIDARTLNLDHKQLRSEWLLGPKFGTRNIESNLEQHRKPKSILKQSGAFATKAAENKQVHITFAETVTQFRPVSESSTDLQQLEDATIRSEDDYDFGQVINAMSHVMENNRVYPFYVHDSVYGEMEDVPADLLCDMDDMIFV